jgi:hypothetical protein
VREDVGCTRVITPALHPCGVTTEKAKRLGSTDTVKRHGKNDFMHHLTPHTMRVIRHEI